MRIYLLPSLSREHLGRTFDGGTPRRRPRCSEGTRKFCASCRSKWRFALLTAFALPVFRQAEPPRPRGAAAVCLSRAWGGGERPGDRGDSTGGVSPRLQGRAAHTPSLTHRHRSRAAAPRHHPRATAHAPPLTRHHPRATAHVLPLTCCRSRAAAHVLSLTRRRSRAAAHVLSLTCCRSRAVAHVLSLT